MHEVRANITFFDPQLCSVSKESVLTLKMFSTPLHHINEEFCVGIVITQLRKEE